MSCIQDSPDQCPMLINTDQCQSKFWHWSQCRSIPINADPAFTLELALVICGPSENKGALIGIERNWSALIGIERHFRSMPWFWSALGIDRGSPVYSSLQLCNLTIIRGRTDAATYVCLETTPWKRGLQWQVWEPFPDRSLKMFVCYLLVPKYALNNRGFFFMITIL